MNLYTSALKKYPNLSNVKTLSIYQKETVEENIYLIILEISSEINILEMRASKFNLLNIDVNMVADSTFPIAGFYQKNCLRQSIKGYCAICNGQYTSSAHTFSNGRCYTPIVKCQAQLAYKCVICTQGFTLFNNLCYQTNKK